MYVCTRKHFQTRSFHSINISPRIGTDRPWKRHFRSFRSFSESLVSSLCSSSRSFSENIETWDKRFRWRSNFQVGDLHRSETPFPSVTSLQWSSLSRYLLAIALFLAVWEREQWPLIYQHLFSDQGSSPINRQTSLNTFLVFCRELNTGTKLNREAIQNDSSL